MPETYQDVQESRIPTRKFRSPRILAGISATQDLGRNFKIFQEAKRWVDAITNTSELLPFVIFLSLTIERLFAQS